MTARPPLPLMTAPLSRLGHDGGLIFDNLLDFLDRIRVEMAAEPEKYERFLETMRSFKSRRCDTPSAVNEIRTILRDHPNLLKSFDQFMPVGFQSSDVPTNEPYSSKINHEPEKASEITSSIVTPPSGEDSNPHVKYARKFLQKIQDNFAEDQEKYRTFLNILELYRSQKISRNDVESQMSELFQSYPDLLEEFVKFQHTHRLPLSDDKTVSENVSRKDSNPRPIKRVRRNLPISNESSSGPKKEPNAGFFQRFSKKLNDAVLFRTILKAFHLYSSDVLRFDELSSLLRENLRHRPQFYARLKNQFGFRDPDDVDPEMFVGNRLSCGPSYRLLSTTEPKLKCSGRTALGEEVLNDVLVSSPTGSEDAGFKMSRKNAYEEELFRCEDQRCEMDLAIELNDSTIHALELILDRLEKLGPRNGQVGIADNEITILHIRAIEKIYGDYAADVVESLYANPQLTIPVVLNRLQQKGLDWRRSRHEFQDAWRETFSRNYAKSLDYQGSYFKLEEKDKLNPRVLVAEIKKRRRQCLLLTDNDKSLHHLSYHICLTSTLHHMVNLVVYASDQASDSKRVEMFFQKFLLPFLFPSHEPSGERDRPKVPFYEANTTSSRRTVFVGNTKIYVLLRLLQIMHDRIHHAFTSRPEESLLGQGFVGLSTSERSSFFFKKVYELLGSSLEYSKYEDLCREMFGLEGYVLYTLDKVVKHIATQIRTILDDPECNSLLSEATPGNEISLLGNAFENLQNQHVFRFEFEVNLLSNGQFAKSGVLKIQLLSLENERSFVNLLHSREKWAAYMHTYLNSEVTLLNLKQHRIFLLRNMNATKENESENCTIDNHLEHKVCMRTYRMFSVHGTEDFFHRPRQCSQHSLVTKRSKRFHRWWSGVQKNSSFILEK